MVNSAENPLLSQGELNPLWQHEVMKDILNDARFVLDDKDKAVIERIAQLSRAERNRTLQDLHNALPFDAEASSQSMKQFQERTERRKVEESGDEERIRELSNQANIVADLIYLIDKHGSMGGILAHQVTRKLRQVQW